MKNTQNVTIVLLVVTAAILTSLLVGGYVYTQPAYAGTGQSKGGDYIMAAGAYNADSDFVYVLDIANNKLAVYYSNINNNSLMIGDKPVDLAKAFLAAGKP
jgi:uncharacterized protein (UPF0333 family)